MTLTELKTLIKDYLQNSETTFVNDLNQIIKQAEDRILNSVQLPVFRKNQTGTTSTDNQYLSIPSDFLANYSLSVTDSSGNQQFLLNKDVNWIRETYPSATATGSIMRYLAMIILLCLPHQEPLLLQRYTIFISQLQ